MICPTCMSWMINISPGINNLRKCITCGFIKEEVKMPLIDWSNPHCKVSNHFTVKEALWLPSWGRLANDSDGFNDTLKQNMISFLEKMDIIRDYFGVQINVHVTYRPEKYNAEIGGAKDSAHMYCKAMDFDVSGMTCDEARNKILNDGKLQEWGLRMEKRPGSDWIHIDQFPAKPNLYFNP